LIAVDASALVAIAQREPERDTFLAVLDRVEGSFLSPINYVEVCVLLIRRRLFTDRTRLDDWLADMGVSRRDDVELSAAAATAYLRYGKGFHPARLNLADCFAYALAKELDLPLLYKGDDFAKTDIRSAL
jgi:ribonuclease VapC